MGADQSSPRGTDKPAASLHSPATEKAPPGGAGLVNGADEDGLPPDVEAYSGRIDTGFGIDGKPRTERHAQCLVAMSEIRLR